MPSIAILILAAGGSSRMEAKIKQLLPWKQSTLLNHAIGQALKLNTEAIFVVLGAQVAQIKPTIEHDKITLLEHKEWEQGIGSTIAFGLKHLSEQKKYDAVFIQLADQPFMDAKYLTEMLETYQKNPSKIIATKYPNNHGVPAIFSRSHWAELAQITGDTGAKQLLKSKMLIAIDPKDKAVDIDTWSDYQKLVQQSNS